MFTDDLFQIAESYGVLNINVNPSITLDTYYDSLKSFVETTRRVSVVQLNVIVMYSNLQTVLHAILANKSIKHLYINNWYMECTTVPFVDPDLPLPDHLETLSIDADVGDKIDVMHYITNKVENSRVRNFFLTARVNEPIETSQVEFLYQFANSFVNRASTNAFSLLFQFSTIFKVTNTAIISRLERIYRLDKSGVATFGAMFVFPQTTRHLLVTMESLPQLIDMKTIGKHLYALSVDCVPRLISSTLTLNINVIATIAYDVKCILDRVDEPMFPRVLILELVVYPGSDVSFILSHCPNAHTVYLKFKTLYMTTKNDVIKTIGVVLDNLSPSTKDFAIVGLNSSRVLDNQFVLKYTIGRTKQYIERLYIDMDIYAENHEFIDSITRENVGIIQVHLMSNELHGTASRTFSIEPYVPWMEYHRRQPRVVRVGPPPLKIRAIGSSIARAVAQYEPMSEAYEDIIDLTNDSTDSD